MAEQAQFLVGFQAGLNNVAPLNKLPQGALRDALNVDISNEGVVRTRSGQTLRVADANAHSLWSMEPFDTAYYVAGGKLKQLALGFLDTELATLASEAPMSFAYFAGRVYYSNGVDLGYIATDGIHPWALEKPTRPPMLMSASYGWREALYQVCLTYVSTTGEESAPSAIGAVQATGLDLQAIPQPVSADIVAVRVYVSTPDSGELYWHSDLAVGVTSLSVTELAKGPLLETQFTQPVPSGHIIQGWQGRMWIAKGNTLYYSEPQRPGIFSIEHNYFRYPSDITLVLPSLDGLYVADQHRTYFLAGNEATELQQLVVAPRGAIPGASALLPADALPPAQVVSGYFPVWWDTNGVLCRGYPGGQIERLTDGRLSTPTYERGTLLYREQDAMKQLLSVFSGTTGRQNQLGAADRVIVEVKNNGF